MSDSEDSTVTYTEISSPYEDLSNVGSPGAEGPIFQDPPSPDYVPGPEEPEQAPPSPIYVPICPEPVYPEFLPKDDGLPAEEQPLPVAASPTTKSPGYIPESDPEEDMRMDDEEASDDDNDDDDDAKEEEHLAPANPAAVAYSADQDPYLAYLRHARLSIDPRRLHRISPEEVAERLGRVVLLLVLDTRSGRGRQLVLLGRLDLPQLGQTFMDLLICWRMRSYILSWMMHDMIELYLEPESMDACDQVRSEGISLWTTVMAQQSEITELQEADRRRQTVISELLKADHRRQRQLVEAL
ncbi:hypothetical protein Tco_0983879 [Tanacetum coccineum]